MHNDFTRTPVCVLGDEPEKKRYFLLLRDGSLMKVFLGDNLGYPLHFPHQCLGNKNVLWIISLSSFTIGFLDKFRAVSKNASSSACFTASSPASFRLLCFHWHGSLKGTLIPENEEQRGRFTIPGCKLRLCQVTRRAIQALEVAQWSNCQAEGLFAIFVSLPSNKRLLFEWLPEPSLRYSH